MGFQISAGVEVKETDLTNIVPSVDTTGAGFVGQFHWGPVLDYTIISDESRLESFFGKPSDTNYIDWFSASSFLSYSSKLNLVRVVDETTALNATYTGTGLLIKNVQHFDLVNDSNSATVFAAKYPGVLGDSIAIHMADSNTFANWAYAGEFDGAPGTSDWSVSKGATNAQDELHIVVVDTTGLISGTPGTILERFGFVSKAKDNKTLDGQPNFYGAIVNTQSQYVWYLGPLLAASYVVDGELDTITLDAPGGDYTVAPAVSISGDGTGATADAVLSSNGSLLSVAVTAGGTGYSVGDAIVITGDGSGATAEVSAETAGVIDTIDVLTAGSGYTAATVDATGTGNGDATGTATLGYTVASLNITNVGSGYSSATVTITGDGTGAAGSVTVIDAGTTDWATVTTPTSIFKQMTAPIAADFSAGHDGGQVGASELIVGWNMFKNSEAVDVSLLFAGDAGGQAASGTVIRHIIDNVVEVRKDCMVFFSPDKIDVFNLPEETAVENAVTFRNVKINRPSSYAVMDSAWKQRYDKFADVYRWIPLNADIAGLAARTDDVADPWWSPAGYTRGQVKNVAQLSYSPAKTSRDILYKNGINPVVSFAGEGVVLYGDRTQQLRSAAFSKINIRRLFIVLEKAIANASKYNLFEINDPFSRSQFRNLIIPFLDLVKSRRGIYEFKVVCDETNNTPEVIDRSEFKASIFIKPAYSINFIELNFVAVRTGVDFNEVVGNV